MILKSKNTPKIEKKGEPIVLGVKGCKSYRKALQTLIGSYYKKGEIELEFHTRGLLNLYNEFHPEKKISVEVKKWKGKSSFELIKELDKLIIIKYQKPEKGMKPIEVRTEVNKQEIQAMINALLKYPNEEVKTRYLAIEYSRNLGLFHSGWKTGINPIFSDRSFHNKYTLLLGALDSLGLVKYLGGKTKLLNKNISIQLIL